MPAVSRTFFGKVTCPLTVTVVAIGDFQVLLFDKVILGGRAVKCAPRNKAYAA
jgi:hypothetical protein